MSVRNFANAPETTLAASCTSLAVTIQVTSTAGLPISYPFTLILDRGGNTEEVVLVTAAAGTTLTVTRGYDSTTAFAHSLGGTVAHGISAIDAREANTHVNATSGVHGIAGALVGTSDTQTLLNKTIGGSNNLTGFTASRLMQSDGAGKIVSGTKAIPTGAVVGDTDAQTLTNKTLTSPVSTGGTFSTPTISSPTITSPIITGPGQILRVVKPADESVTNSVVLQIDDALVLNLPAVGTYIFKLWIMADADLSTGAADLRFSVNYSGTVSRIVYAVNGAETGVGDMENTNSTFRATNVLNDPMHVGLGSGLAAFSIEGSLVATSSGNLLFNWCQRVAGVTICTVRAGSYMRVERVS